MGWAEGAVLVQQDQREVGVCVGGRKMGAGRDGGTEGWKGGGARDRAYVRGGGAGAHKVHKQQVAAELAVVT